MIRGTRFTVAQMLAELADGSGPDELAYAYRLDADAIRGALNQIADSPVLDAVARGADGDRVEKYARAICAANGVDPEALMYDDDTPEWLFYQDDARVAIALADAEAVVRKEAETSAETKTPWARASISRAAGLCMCRACVRDRDEASVTMHLCPECGNKRCPKASDHRLACTGSNAVGQPGSLF